MKEIPILFSGPMVNAILEGRKTQTRRILKGNLPDDPTAESGKNWGFVGNGFYYCGVKCPYGVPGDRLWVREAWGYRGLSTCGSVHKAMVSYAVDGVRREIRFPTFEGMMAATPKQNWKKPEGFDELDEFEQGFTHSEWLSKWWKQQKTKPGIHMFRWASRLTLEITGVRVERLQDISKADIEAEGFTNSDEWLDFIEYYEAVAPKEVSTRESEHEYFAKKWDGISGKREGCAWADNPWLWVIEFKRLENSECGYFWSFDVAACSPGLSGDIPRLREAQTAARLDAELNQ